MSAAEMLLKAVQARSSARGRHRWSREDLQYERHVVGTSSNVEPET